MSDDLAPALPHEVYPAPTIADRICDTCYDLTGDWHTFDEHVLDMRTWTMRCDARNALGKRKCRCRDFVCIEHRDNACDPD